MPVTNVPYNSVHFLGGFKLEEDLYLHSIRRMEFDSYLANSVERQTDRCKHIEIM